MRGAQMMEALPLLRDRARRPVAYAIAIVASLAAAVLRWAIGGALPPGYPFVVFLPVIVFVTILFGRGPGTLAGAVSGLLAWYLFIGPGRTFALDGPHAFALIFYTFVVAVIIAAIGWMQAANARLAAERTRSRQLAERTELLFSELQHRVSNNLQMIGAVLALQRKKVGDPAAVQALADASTKLQLIGRIQRQLYDTSGAQVALDVFVGELASDLIAAGGKPGVRCDVDAEPGLLLSPDAVIPVALILAEAIANSIEHGFADADESHEGRIVVKAQRLGDTIALSVRDDGRGLPPGFDMSGADSLGLKIARTLSRQLEATFTLRDAAPGTLMELKLPSRSALLQPS
jgi:two-component sensor histidine kinase